ncbi:MAG: intradiol ring-cleavage dioxygenase [Sphingopyxis sp.]|nr:intradiol ring-cleavage dioxygenase [Sphingopyxis sp.]
MTKMSRRATLLGLTVLGATGLATAWSRAVPAQAMQRPRNDLYACEGCEAIDERDPATLSASAILAGPEEPGERMHLSGQVFALDGITPVQGVVIYAHHTNIDGLYANGTAESEWSRRNGRLRGWVKTDAEGRYAFDTIKPAPYPDFTGPAHVHLYVKEAGRQTYYVDDVVFESEFKVDASYRATQEFRGGSGIVRLGKDSDGVLTAVRDIRLEPHPV